MENSSKPNTEKPIKTKGIKITGKENLLALLGVRDKIKEYKNASYMEKSLIEHLHKFEQPYPNNVHIYSAEDNFERSEPTEECCKSLSCTITSLIKPKYNY
eukprot:GAHX01002197.1.p1 GENE.GAHX01002197.1~~GAHX01002197.1.p1  ORF type:complete len:111 (-),score=32.51 GAHX01002197.1:150-452(-)